MWFILSHIALIASSYWLGETGNPGAMIMLALSFTWCATEWHMLRYPGENESDDITEQQMRERR